MVYREVIGFHV